MRILILGASSQIGINILKLLLSNKIHVIAHTHTKEIKINNKYLEKIKFDIGNSSSYEILQLNKISTIINCIGETRNSKTMMKINYFDTINIIKYVLLHKLKKKTHWIQISSIGVYRNCNILDDLHIDENKLPNPKNVYEKSKYLADKFIIETSQKYKEFYYTIFRPSIIFGPEFENRTIKLMYKYIDKGFFFYIGHKKTILPFVHISDLVFFIVSSIDNLKAQNEIYNITNNEKLSDVIEKISDCLNRKPPTLCLNEKFVRFIVFTLSLLVNLPLKNSNIDFFVSKKIFSIEKLKKTYKNEPKILLVNKIFEIIKK